MDLHVFRIKAKFKHFEFDRFIIQYFNISLTLNLKLIEVKEMNAIFSEYIDYSQ